MLDIQIYTHIAEQSLSKPRKNPFSSERFAIKAQDILHRSFKKVTLPSDKMHLQLFEYLSADIGGGMVGPLGWGGFHGC